MLKFNKNFKNKIKFEKINFESYEKSLFFCFEFYLYLKFFYHTMHTYI